MENKKFNNNQPVLTLQEQTRIRIEKIDKLKEKGVAPFGAKFDVKDRICDIKANYLDIEKEELEAKNVKATIAGRIITKRDMGKIAFCNLQDRDGNIQIYIRKDVIGEEAYSVFKLSDLGDIIGVTGDVMKTNTGELSIKVTEYTHLTKALRPLPEKYHGLQDVEERYRRRYVDLIVNEQSRKTAIARTRIVREMQNYFDSLGFIEVETPCLTGVLTGASARPFITHHNTLDRDYYLRIATELPLKRLLVGGLERVYEFGRLFRNEGMDTKHSPEFTTVELYQAFGDLRSMMELCETSFKRIAKNVFNGQEEFEWNGHVINVAKPFKVVAMVDLVKEVTGIDFNEITSFEQAKQLAEERELFVPNHFTTVGHILNLFFEEYCEKTLIQPTFLTRHPVEISPLTKVCEDDPRYVDRFELFIAGCEFANAYSELNDPIDQRERFIKQLEEKNLGNDEAGDIDKIS